MDLEILSDLASASPNTVPEPCIFCTSAAFMPPLPELPKAPVAYPKPAMTAPIAATPAKPPQPDCPNICAAPAITPEAAACKLLTICAACMTLETASIA